MEEQELLSEAARLIAGRRKIVQVTCAVCGKITEGTKKRKYCGPVCAAKAFYDANQERVVREKRERRAGRSPRGVSPDVAAAAAPSAAAPAPADATGPESGTP